MFAEPTRAMTKDELDLICEVWDDKGSDDSTGLWFELWDGADADDYPEQRDQILAIASDCGLVANVEDGILRMQKTQQLHDEIKNHWI